MADSIKQQYDADVEYIEGGGGIFDVRLDGQLIYSKDQTGRFPEHDEILEILGKAAGKPT